MISQQSRRLERHDKVGNTGRPGGGDFCRVTRVSAVEVDHVSTRVVVGSILRDPPAELLQNYGRFVGTMLGGFRGYFLWFSEICLREEAVAGDFCVGEFLELFESRICLNAHEVERVLLGCG